MHLRNQDASYCIGYWSIHALQIEFNGPLTETLNLKSTFLQILRQIALKCGMNGRRVIPAQTEPGSKSGLHLDSNQESPNFQPSYLSSIVQTKLAAAHV